MSGQRVIVCELGPGWENYRPELFPGSDKAHAKGCTCPVLQPWPGRLAFAEDCPHHQLEKSVN